MLEHSTSKRIDSMIEGENERLRQDHSGVTIIRRGKRLYLRATLPPKLRSSKKKPHQQYLALGVYANTAGVKTATAEARKVSALVSLRQFNWEPYLRQTQAGNVMTFGDLVERFKENRLRYSRAKNREKRWNTIESTLILLPLKEEFTQASLEKAVLAIVESIASTPKDGKLRNTKQVLSQFINFIKREKPYES